MNRMKCSIMVLMFCVLSVIFSKAVFGEDSADEQNSDVSLTITKFHVNNQALELGWRIMNDSDHDVWICESMSRDYPPPLFEQFLDEDAKTLVIRKRFDLPMRWYEYPPIGSRYVRLLSGEEKVEFVSVALPVRPYQMSVANKVTNAEYAERLALEIGYYDEDLPALILEIVELAEFLNCDLLVGLGENVELGERFFGGRQIAQYYNHIIGFGPNVRSADTDGEIWIPDLGGIRMGEKVLRIEVDGVSIPYKSNYPPLTDEPPQGETEPAGVTMALTGFDVNDTKLELSWKIKNDSDHDVWICESMSRDYPPPLFEQFLDEDAKTLVIRKLFDLPMREELTLAYPPIGSRYAQLSPGEEKVESVSVALPVRPYRMSASNKVTNAEYAKCLALEIGYYDEDLPALILEIVELVEHLDIDFSANYSSFREELIGRFFNGPKVAQSFKYLLGFESNVRSADADGEMWMPHFYKVRMGERILRIEVDGVSIPYESNYPPLND
jgi:hypothetical protein